MTEEERKAELKSLYARIKVLDRKVINSDFMFEPKIDVRADHCSMLIRGATLPVLESSDDCAVVVNETTTGAGRAIVQAMKDAGAFDAVVYEGWDERYHSKRFLRCTYVSVDPVSRDWVNRETITSYTVRLKMVETSIEYTEHAGAAVA
jgi:hypothetical protein